jgi:hypothetical protein
MVVRRTEVDEGNSICAAEVSLQQKEVGERFLLFGIEQDQR